MKFVLIPAGSFMMGCGLSLREYTQKYGGIELFYKTERPLHKVTISKSFYLQTKVVTVGHWRRFVNETGYKTEMETARRTSILEGFRLIKGKGQYWDNPGFFQDDSHPITLVSWSDVSEFIHWLNRMEGTKRYRLSTEAEWEYACRAGSTTEFSFGNDLSKLAEYAWYRDNSKDRTHPVGTKKPNPWGLYDIHGNVWEWMEDDYHDN